MNLLLPAEANDTYGNFYRAYRSIPSKAIFIVNVV